ncbi:hypothetical protein AQPE_4462 [Aquipluma nitroreducens]|uniref:Uncharacterized protein n=1 Tax=Aquipluma nitroreducens TaxID=2010828 RepID=A0A5K7SF94_9BACT|nr:hypothetical protein AQPE_4462 [Aquipluma nitroreducens]
MLANPRLRQGFIEAEEVKPLLKLATEALLSKNGCIGLTEES